MSSINHLSNSSKHFISQISQEEETMDEYGEYEDTYISEIVGSET
jgi:hypothetical protein